MHVGVDLHAAHEPGVVDLEALEGVAAARDHPSGSDAAPVLQSLSLGQLANLLPTDAGKRVYPLFLLVTGITYGMGMNKRQTRRSVRWEAIIVSTFATRLSAARTVVAQRVAALAAHRLWRIRVIAGDIPWPAVQPLPAKDQP